MLKTMSKEGKVFIKTTRIVCIIALFVFYVRNISLIYNMSVLSISHYNFTKFAGPLVMED
jgi:hypothetical protein